MAYPVTVEWREHVEVGCSDDLSDLLDRIASESEPGQPPLVIITNEGGEPTIGVGAPVAVLSHVPPSSICRIASSSTAV